MPVKSLTYLPLCGKCPGPNPEQTGTPLVDAYRSPVSHSLVSLHLTSGHPHAHGHKTEYVSASPFGAPLVDLPCLNSSSGLYY